MDTYKMFINLIISLSFVLGLIIFISKILGSKVNEINGKKYIKIIDRVQITKENSLIIIKVGKKGYIMSSSSSNMQKLEELSQEEINKIEEDRKNSIYDIKKLYHSDYKTKFLDIFNNFKSKEDKDGKE
ncbi:flagellar biosynthetic protein FliO [Clostridium weizhouense]|uniref:Flagellar biosynthetic protein FliO n=1 Tax=Clostridium weizhouense TaxID=2859781 RepID=A0ABS7AIQ0_9CLOT|nr:flagellar biosynthetic protein FliO [Clostridium weizhouense]MBW6408549.1 flagellar biosynthetic protein FliO [Clostridium weizhouense]